MVYGLSSTGMTVNFHYCCGKLKKVEFSSDQSDCGMKMKHSSGKKCCDNNLLDLKVKSDQKIVESAKLAFKATALPLLFSDFHIANPIESKYLTPSIFAPPPPFTNQLYILLCDYRI